MKELTMIQRALKCPKSQFNKFGGYAFRNCEDIMEAVKPLCAEHDCTLTVSDTIEHIGERYYVKATATIKNSQNEAESVTAYAREDEMKKGMDAAQITGAASSYARKYALGGLLCLDDTKDADTTNTHDAEAKKGTKITASGESLLAQKVQKAIAKLQELNTKDEIAAFYAQSPSEWRHKGTEFYIACENRLNQINESNGN